MPDKGPNTDKSAKDQQEKKPVLKLVKTEDVDVSSDAKLHAAEVKVAEETREDIAEELSVRDEDVEVVSEKEGGQGEFTQRTIDKLLKTSAEIAEEEVPPSKALELTRPAPSKPIEPEKKEEAAPDTEVMEDEDLAPDTQRSPGSRPANFDEKRVALAEQQKSNPDDPAYLEQITLLLDLAAGEVDITKLKEKGFRGWSAEDAVILLRELNVVSERDKKKAGAEETPTKSEAAPTVPLPTVAEEGPATLKMPGKPLLQVIDAVSKDDPKKKKQLLFLWNVYKEQGKGKDAFADDPTKTRRIKSAMNTAELRSQDDPMKAEEVVQMLHIAMLIAEGKEDEIPEDDRDLLTGVTTVSTETKETAEAADKRLEGFEVSPEILRKALAYIDSEEKIEIPLKSFGTVSLLKPAQDRLHKALQQLGVIVEEEGKYRVDHEKLDKLLGKEAEATVETKETGAKETKAEEKAKEKTEEEKKPKESAEFDTLSAVRAFMESVGFPFDEKDPASMAISAALYSNVKEQADLDQLRNFLNDAKYGDAIDEKYGLMKPKELEDLLDEKEPEFKKVKTQISSREKQLESQKNRPTPEEARKLEEELKPLYQSKRKLESEVKNLNIALERAKGKESAETTYIQRPEQLLGMINIFFAKKKMKGGTPNYAQIMAETQEQLQMQYEAQSERASKVLHFFNPLTYFKPRLTSTLKAIVEGDEMLKKIKPEQAEKLAKAWNSPGGVRNWIRSLEGSEQENMQIVVPAIIGHLTRAVNEGWGTRLNPVSIKRGRGLLKNMRDAVHQYSISQAEKGKGGSLDKMNAYFEQLNGINKAAADVNYKIVRNHAWWSMAKNVGKTVGVAGAGAAGFGVGYAGFVGATTVAGWGSAAYSTLAGLSTLETIGLGAGAASAGLAAGSLGVKDPKMKAWMRRTSFRLAAATGFGALTVASIPWAALPSMVSGAASSLSGTPWLTLGAAAGGFFLPDVWKNRKGITKKVPGVVGGTAKTTLKLGLAAGGLGLAALAFGLPLISRRYREAFFGPLVGKLPSLPARPSPMPTAVPATAPANDNVLPLKRPLPRAA